MDQLAQEWQRKFETIWGPEGQYRKGSPGLRIVPRFAGYAPKGCTVNDYGAGTGRAAVELRKLGYRVNMVDIAPNALEDEARGILGPDLTHTIAPLWSLPADFPHAEWGYCMEVLQLLPPEKLMDSLKEIRRTSDNCFFQICKWHDKRCGMDVHLSVQEPEWWRERLTLYWPEVEQISSHEISTRLLFVCKGKFHGPS